MRLFCCLIIFVPFFASAGQLSDSQALSLYGDYSVGQIPMSTMIKLNPKLTIPANSLCSNSSDRTKCSICAKTVSAEARRFNSPLALSEPPQVEDGLGTGAPSVITFKLINTLSDYVLKCENGDPDLKVKELTRELKAEGISFTFQAPKAAQGRPAVSASTVVN